MTLSGRDVATSEAAWADRAADRSPAVQRSRARSARQAKVIVDGARRLIQLKGASFTTQELAAEAGVALKTFYRHFAGKDQLLLAVFEDEIAQQMIAFGAFGRELSDPVARLRFYITGAVRSLTVPSRPDGGALGPRFITAEHWRLHQLFPEEMMRANQPFADLIEKALRQATAEGRLRSTDPAQDAWFMMKLVMSVFHHFAFVTGEGRVDDIAERLSAYCLAAVGISPEASAGTRATDDAPVVPT